MQCMLVLMTLGSAAARRLTSNSGHEPFFTIFRVNKLLQYETIIIMNNK